MYIATTEIAFLIHNNAFKSKPCTVYISCVLWLETDYSDLRHTTNVRWKHSSNVICHYSRTYKLPGMNFIVIEQTEISIKIIL